jgi:phosphoesterase RecJ-like protein
MKTNLTALDVANRLKQAHSILIVSHVNPDADAFGSSCGLALALRELGKQVVVINESGMTDRLEFIPGTALVQSDFPTGSGSPETYDLHCIVDCGDLKRVGDTFVEKIRTLSPLLNIDHHISNTHYGHQNFVVTEACSTSELIFRILDAGSIKISPPVATALFAGISGDTGSFRYSNTTAAVFATAQRLVEAGAEPGFVASQLYSRVRRASMLVSSAALGEAEFFAEGRLAWIEVPQSLADRFGAVREDTEGVVERGRDIEGVAIACFLREEGDIWKVSMRSRHEYHNVSNIAQVFGGGGHAMAAAFRWRGTHADLKVQLRGALEQLLTSTPT